MYYHYPVRIENNQVKRKINDLNKESESGDFRKIEEVESSLKRTEEGLINCFILSRILKPDQESV
jgi:hypothetical protein